MSPCPKVTPVAKADIGTAAVGAEPVCGSRDLIRSLVQIVGRDLHLLSPCSSGKQQTNQNDANCELHHVLLLDRQVKGDRVMQRTARASQCHKVGLGRLTEEAAAATACSHARHRQKTQ